jgi:hypothetical protein
MNDFTKPLHRPVESKSTLRTESSRIANGRIGRRPEVDHQAAFKVNPPPGRLLSGDSFQSEAATPVVT